MWLPQNKISHTGISFDLPVPTLCFQWSLLDPDVSFDTGTDLDPAKLFIRIRIQLYMETTQIRWTRWTGGRKQETGDGRVVGRKCSQIYMTDTGKLVPFLRDRAGQNGDDQDR